MAKEQKKPPLPQPELPNIPPRPQEIKQIYLVTIIQHKERVYCKVDYNKQTSNQETLGEIFTTVRQLERILNKLKKSNIEIDLTKPVPQPTLNVLDHEINFKEYGTE